LLVAVVEHHAVKTCGEMAVKLHTFVTSV
jgi:hypothetical protein